MEGRIEKTGHILIFLGTHVGDTVINGDFFQRLPVYFRRKKIIQRSEIRDLMDDLPPSY